ncbi:glycoside hydrolase family 43 protein [Bifidobacterium pullorum subsp. saeculare]|uniref:Glycoside hydrolase family 43 protein n=1 Tax=Bifidobacterium pullorum subsp. saeculare TaxID=78257 RepID=A0A938WYK9_9BIFI|nr:glycoside hydrolase family 43 protein [Bifidobacterium pullorum]MBM6699975.1 glycoside hydrolase family 43 protein [Bifidobacterium pullorum subsp. saeculare]
MQSVTFIENPVLRGMYPDPSWMWDEAHERIAMVNSSFELVPGLPIHVSDDLGRWKHLADAIDADMARRLLIPFVADSGGVYAPTLRRIAGRYVIACTIARIDADLARRGGATEAELAATAAADGNFIIEADRLEGPWRGPFWIAGAEGIDPDIFEDSDGTVWWTQTRPSHDPQWEGQTEVWTRRLDPADWSLADDGAPGGRTTVLWRGYGVEAVWAEGPHLVRVGDWVYLFTAEGGTSFEHSEMAMRTHAPHGLRAAIGAFLDGDGGVEGDVAVDGASECRVVGTHRRLFHANKKNPILTHRHLGLAEPVQCVGHGDLIHHPRLGWWMVCLGVRETKGPNPGELLSYLGREPFLAPVTWEHNPASWKLDGGGAPVADAGDPGWPVVAPGLGRLPERIALMPADGRGDADDADDASDARDWAGPGMVEVADGRGARVAIGLGRGSDDAGAGAAAGSRLLDADREADLIIRDETGVRYARIASDNVLMPVPAGGTLVIRQNSTHLAVVRQSVAAPSGLSVLTASGEPAHARVSCTLIDGDHVEPHDYGEAGGAVAVLLRDNALTVIACGRADDLRQAADAVAGGAALPSGTRVLGRHDARFLSTEWAGGFVGCLAGVLTGEGAGMPPLPAAWNGSR